MSSALSPAGQRPREILADGAWHDVGEVLRAIAPAVEPAKAYRSAEGNRVAGAQRRSSAGVRVKGSEVTAVSTGQRRKAHEVIRSAVKSGVAERNGSRVRLVGVLTPSPEVVAPGHIVG